MTLIQPRSADAFVRKPDAHMAVVLVYGPDTGLVSERVKALVKVSVDDPADPFQLVQIDGDEVAAAGLAISSEAREALMGLLGGDRLATRSELKKLTLYAHGAGRIEVSDVLAVVGDASLLATDEIIDSAFSGEADALDRNLT